MKEVQATEAKAHLAELLNLVMRGQTIAITRQGRRIAHLVPADAQDEDLRREAVSRFRSRRGQWSKAGMGVDEILSARHEGHRL